MIFPTIVSCFYFWTILSIMLALIELINPGLFVCLAFSFSSIITAGFSLVTDHITTQTTLFFIIGVCLFFLFKTKLNKFNYSHKQMPHVTSNTQALIGKDATLKQDLQPGEQGFAVVEKEMWSCKNNSLLTLNKNNAAVVVNIQGNTLILKSKEQ